MQQNMADEQLIRLFQQHYSDLVRIVYVFLGNHATAEEIAQEAFIKLRNAKRRPNTGEEVPWLRHVALNMARTKWRRNRLGAQLKRTIYKEPSYPGPDSQTERAEAVHTLRHLPARQKEVLLLRYYLDLTEKETAETLGISVGSVKTHSRRGIKKLRSFFEETNG